MCPLIRVCSLIRSNTVFRKKLTSVSCSVPGHPGFGVRAQSTTEAAAETLQPTDPRRGDADTGERRAHVT